METITAPEHEAYIQAAGAIAERISACAAKGSCTIAIAGGRSIPQVLERLLPYAHQFIAPTPIVITVFWADERIGPEKNYADALTHLERLRHAGVAIEWHPLQSVQRQAMELEMHRVAGLIDQAGLSATHFDLVVLSAGEDGHIASLFPRHQSLKALHHGYIIEEASPKPPAQRVTMTPALLCSARSAMLFFIGKKREAYSLFTNPKAPVEECPAKMLLAVPDLKVYVSLQ